MNIILTGFMGCGKTTLGKWIARKKRMGFIDTDEYIQFKTGRSINDIFAEDGEEFFRDLETKAIKDLIGTTLNSIIAVGGGLPVRADNRELLKKLGRVVYLETSKEELINRLRNSNDRPMLKGDDLNKRIDDLMKLREKLYIDGADVIVKTDGLEFEQIYQEIVKVY